MVYTGTHKEKIEKELRRRDNLSKYLYDVSKIIVSFSVATFIPQLLSGDMKDWYFLVVVGPVGFLIAYFFAAIANKMMNY